MSDKFSSQIGQSHFKSEQRAIQYLFDGRKIYSIPRYQREYVWDEKNWHDLISDIEYLLDEGGRVNWTHFIGPIVLREEDREDRTIQYYEVIDGQQRITTLFILMLVIHARAQELKSLGVEHFWLEEGREDLIGMWLALNFKNADGRRQLKLVNSELSDLLHSFMTCIAKGDYRIKEAIHADKGTASQERLKKLYLYYYDRFAGGGDGGKGNAGYEVEKLYSLYNCLLQIQYVEITSKYEEESYSIFEVLNARGSALTDLDLLKNFTMKHLLPCDDDYEDHVKAKWSNIRNNLSAMTAESKTKQANVVGDFLHLYIDNKMIDTQVSDYRNIKSVVKRREMGEFLDDFYDYSRTVKFMSILMSDDFEMSFFKSRKVTQMNPLFYALHLRTTPSTAEIRANPELKKYYNINESQNVFHTSDDVKLIRNITVHDFKQTVRILRNFYILTMLQGVRGNKYYRDIRKVANDVYRAGGAFAIKVRLIKLIEDLYGYIDMDMLEKIWFEKPVIKYSNKISGLGDGWFIKHILKSIYDSLQTDNPIVLDNLTIEHLVPDAKASSDSHQIGNLTLLTRELNEKLKDKPLSVKIPIIMQKSTGIYPNQQLGQFYDADSSSICMKKRHAFFWESFSSGVLSIDLDLFHISAADIENYHEFSSNIRDELLREGLDDVVLTVESIGVGKSIDMFRKRLNDPLSSVKQRNLKALEVFEQHGLITL